MGAIKFGVSNVYYALATDDGSGNLTYGTPKPLKGAVSLTLDAQGETATEYADNVVWYNASANNGYAGSLEVKLLSDDFRKDVLKETADKNGVLIENADAQSAEFALLWQFEIGGDSAIKGKRGCLYRCSVNRPGINGATKENAIAGQNETISITAMPRVADHAVRASVTSDQATAYNGWFSAVYEKATN